MDNAKEAGSLLGRIRKVPSGLPRSILSASERLQSTSQFSFESCGRATGTGAGGGITSGTTVGVNVNMGVLYCDEDEDAAVKQLSNNAAMA